MNGTVIYAAFDDGDINNSAKVLEFIPYKSLTSKDDRHACLEKSGCEIIISEWHKSKHKYYEKQIIEYNSNDAVNVSITLKKEPRDVSKRFLRQTGINVLENGNSTMHYKKVLTPELDNMNLYVEASNMLNNSCYRITAITYKYVDRQIIPNESRHACLSSCEIIINVDQDDIYCNGTIRKNTTNKKDPASEDIAKKVFGRNDTGGVYWIPSYVSQNQIIYPQLHFDRQKFELPKTTNTTIYSRVIGILKQK
ncbi:uncharacterized protein LOC123668255 [Melitaea cinxia]|uniref:uncharacterized protein LOC123668255 n=1 Tax=Melitaea cinxia TaxID=113334 RepID=UPI001E272237|nr:uncharacterized protein LOC123668255 [Melitaea cinxia]